MYKLIWYRKQDLENGEEKFKESSHFRSVRTVKESTKITCLAGCKKGYAFLTVFWAGKLCVEVKKFMSKFLPENCTLNV